MTDDWGRPYTYTVSVPLRGKYCRESQGVTVEYIRDMGSRRFPSPCGVNIVGYALVNVGRGATVAFAVSVPLRGKYCREYSNGTEDVLIGYASFRPLAG